MTGDSSEFCQLLILFHLILGVCFYFLFLLESVLKHFIFLETCVLSVYNFNTKFDLYFIHIFYNVSAISIP